jgi:uncharacterized protein YigE (DUF2233 family)
MKKYLLIILAISFLVVTLLTLLFFNRKEKDSINIPPIKTDQKNGQIDTSDTITPTTKLNNIKSVWISVNDQDKLFLYSNLLNKGNTKDLATKNTCAQLVSGGFYDTNNKHIGLFVSEGETISESQENVTFNGYFNVSKTGVVSITEYPIFSPRISIQSGPFLLKNSKKVDLNMENDENARRIAVGVSKNGLIYFFAFYDQGNSFSGPKFSDLPGLIEKLNFEKKLNLVNVINLDGGAHSAFLSDLVNLHEASTIGSYFCIKP